MKIKDLRLSTGMERKGFADYFNVPYRTLQNWELGLREAPEYVTELIEYKIKNEREKKEMKKAELIKRIDKAIDREILETGRMGTENVMAQFQLSEEERELFGDIDKYDNEHYGWDWDDENTLYITYTEDTEYLVEWQEYDQETTEYSAGTYQESITAPNKETAIEWLKDYLVENGTDEYPGMELTDDGIDLGNGTEYRNFVAK